MDDVFSNGSTIKKYPFLLKYLPTKIEKGSKVQIVISIPKRNIKKATARNRIRRQIKEVYRLNKAELTALAERSDQELALFLIYTAKEKIEYDVLDSKLKLILSELIKQLS